MSYRTKTYIAADWDSDENAVNELYKWNKGKKWNLTFNNAHDLTQSRDSSLYCTIKNSLKKRMDASKTFVLIVGNNTDKVTKGGCQYCKNYNTFNSKCSTGHSIDYRSYIKLECEKAVESGINIVVLYKSLNVYKSKCPNILKDKGNHVAMYCIGEDGEKHWDYDSIKKALEV